MMQLTRITTPVVFQMQVNYEELQALSAAVHNAIIHDGNDKNFLLYEELHVAMSAAILESLPDVNR